jgi:hypothetical protein
MTPTRDLIAEYLAAQERYLMALAELMVAKTAVEERYQARLRAGGWKHEERPALLEEFAGLDDKARRQFDRRVYHIVKGLRAEWMREHQQQ